MISCFKYLFTQISRDFIQVPLTVSVAHVALHTHSLALHWDLSIVKIQFPTVFLNIEPTISNSTQLTTPKRTKPY